MRDWRTESDERLLAMTPGSPGAFSEFYGRYERLVLWYFMRRVHDPELAADLAAEVFAAALVGTRRFRVNGAPASVWLFAIAEHKLANSRRRGRVEDRARRRLSMDPILLMDEDIERIDRLGRSEEEIAGLLAGLPVAQRDAIRARVLDERSYAEIARELVCSEAVVRKRVSRGLARLRDQWTEEC